MTTKRPVFKYIIASIILIIIFIGAICIYTYYTENARDRTTYSYNITITSNNSLPYLLIMPVPLISDQHSPNLGNATKIVSELSIIDGVGNFSLIDCKYGKGLEIQAIGNIKLLAKKEVNGRDTESLSAYGFGEISLATTASWHSNRYLFFNSSDDMDIDLNFECKNIRDYYRGGHQYVWGLHETISNMGWNNYTMLIKSETD